MLADAYPGRARPLGAARVLCEIGSGTSLRELRTRLGLDPGYLSRIVRTLEDEGLVRLSAHPEDGRLRVARLTAAGETELEEQHRRANVAAESLLDALTIASLSGISVKLLVPGRSDSILVDAAASSYYDDLLKAGVEIYQYRKGFIHAKTFVADSKIAIVGTANMDFRSFDLNFEVNAIVYDAEVASELRNIFFDDLKDAERIDPDLWYKRSRLKQFWQKTARLVSPLL